MRYLLLWSISCFMIGCGSEPEGQISGMSKVNGYSFTLLSNDGGSVMNRSIGDQLKVTLGTHEVGLDQTSGKLMFDGKEVGTVARGDKVIVDARGRLFVNGRHLATSESRVGPEKSSVRARGTGISESPSGPPVGPFGGRARGTSPRLPGPQAVPAKPSMRIGEEGILECQMGLGSFLAESRDEYRTLVAGMESVNKATMEGKTPPGSNRIRPADAARSKLVPIGTRVRVLRVESDGLEVQILDGASLGRKIWVMPFIFKPKN